MDRRRLIFIIGAAVVALVVVGAAGVLIGRSVGAGNTNTQTAPPTQAPPTNPAACPAQPENATEGTLTEAPQTEWVQATDRVWLPKTKGGPLKNDRGFGECFTPDAEGAVTAAYYYWAMTDPSFPEDVRRKAFETYVPAQDKGRDSTIETRLKGEDVDLTGFSFNVPISKNQASITMTETTAGETYDRVISLIWLDGTWRLGDFPLRTDVGPAQESETIRWERD